MPAELERHYFPEGAFLAEAAPPPPGGDPLEGDRAARHYLASRLSAAGAAPLSCGGYGGETFRFLLERSHFRPKLITLRPLRDGWRIEGIDFGFSYGRDMPPVVARTSAEVRGPEAESLRRALQEAALLAADTRLRLDGSFGWVGPLGL